MTLAGRGGEIILANRIRFFNIKFYGIKNLAMVNFIIKSTRGWQPAQNLREASSQSRIFLVSLI